MLLTVLGCAIGCSDKTPPVGPHCIASEFVTEIAIANIDRVDLLFVIGDSPSMAQEQASLRTQLPALMHMLMTGMIDAQTQTLPEQDVHVAIVSATLAGGRAPQPVPASGVTDCAAQYPAFLGYRGPYFGPDRTDADQFIDDFGCAMQLGSSASGANQALEAALSALSDPAPGFLRNDPIGGGSLIGVVVVTDTDDCSALSGAAPQTTAACAARADALQSVEHYVTGLRALRKGNENMVVFGAITVSRPSWWMTHLTTASIPTIRSKTTRITTVSCSSRRSERARQRFA